MYFGARVLVMVWKLGLKEKRRHRVYPSLLTWVSGEIVY